MNMQEEVTEHHYSGKVKRPERLVLYFMGRLWLIFILSY